MMIISGQSLPDEWDLGLLRQHVTSFAWRAAEKNIRLPPSDSLRGYCLRLLQAGRPQAASSQSGPGAGGYCHRRDSYCPSLAAGSRRRPAAGGLRVRVRLGIRLGVTSLATARAASVAALLAIIISNDYLSLFVII